MGNFNGSLFATEGIASVGPLWAPLSALVCGLIVSLGNSASARLPAPVHCDLGGTSPCSRRCSMRRCRSACCPTACWCLWLLWALTPD